MATGLGEALAKRGHEIHFITYDTPFRLDMNANNIFFHQVEINQYDLFKYPDYALSLSVKMAEVARNARLDLWHVHYAIPHAASAYLAKKLMGEKAPKIITTLHGTDITLVGKDPSYHAVVKFSIEESDGVTAVSESLKKEMCRNFRICRDVRVIYNFVVPHPPKKNIRAQIAAPDEKVIVHASNFRFLKRVPDVVRIFHEIRKKVPSKLVLVGVGPMLEEVKELVTNLSLEEHVHFFGVAMDVDPFLAASDLFLLPSAQESFGLAALEAMMYGVPVIASRVGGLPELIEDKVSGFLFPPGAIQDMSRMGVELLQNATLARQISAAAKERATTTFNADRIVSEYEQFYLSLF